MWHKSCVLDNEGKDLALVARNALISDTQLLQPGGYT